MASETLHFPTLLLVLVIILLYNCINCNSAKPSTSSSTSCPSFDCGNGMIMGYPFWLKSQQSQYCGYQGFGLSCNGDEPTLSLSNHLYNVRDFNKLEKTFTITYANLNYPECPFAEHDVVLNTSTSLINYTSVDQIIHFFYNCSLYPPSLQDIKCLQFGAVKRSFVFVDGAIPEFDWEKYCEAMVKVPVTEISREVGGDLVIKDFGRALLEGFKLTWKTDLACQSCEDTGGFCGQKTIGISQKFICFCGDSQHPFHCDHDSGTVSISYEPNYIAIGAFVLGGLSIMSTILFHIRKMNIGPKNQGFSQIPK